MKQLLSGAIILDITRATAGPFGSQLLGQLGAGVIKVETPAGGFNFREMFEGNAYQKGGMDSAYLAVNSAKKSIVVDLGISEGMQVFSDLVKKANAVVDNFRPGVLESLKLDYETLRAINPAIISCSLSGYGSSGPFSRKAGFDITLQAQSGMLAFIDKRDGDGIPADPNVSIADLLGGTYVAVGIASALHYQARTGKGCRIDVAIYDALISWFGAAALYFLNFGERPDLKKNMLWGAFKTKDRPIVIAAHRNAPFRKLCHALGHDEWSTDERFSNPAKRRANGLLLKTLVADELARKSSQECLEILEKGGAPCAEIAEMKETLAGAQAAQRNMVVTANHPRYGDVRLLGAPIKVDGLEETCIPPPLPGEHTTEILSKLLGYSQERIAALRENGAIV